MMLPRSSLVTSGLLLVVFCIGIAYFSQSYKDDLLTSTSDNREYRRNAQRRANAVIVILIREEELEPMYASLLQFESTFNSMFHYPYVFLNDKPFTEDFKTRVTSLLVDKYNTEDDDSWRLTRNVSFGLIPKEHWSYPDWIDKDRAAENRRKSEKAGIMYGGSESYRHMCRFFSGFFYKHPLLLQYDYYWRIEPGVQYFCQLDYDPFLHMMDNNFEYSFVIVYPEGMETIPTLWNTTKAYMKDVYPNFKSHRLMSPKVPGLKLTLDADSSKDHDAFLEKLFNGEDAQEQSSGKYAQGYWRGCHYWNNFEIGHFSFFRSPLYQSYFDYLDKAGGFFYERWGDAPVHSLAVGLFLEVSQIHHFTDVGYRHGDFTWCPVDEQSEKKCICSKDSRHNLAGNRKYFFTKCSNRHRALQAQYSTDTSS